MAVVVSTFLHTLTTHCDSITCFGELDQSNNRPVMVEIKVNRFHVFFLPCTHMVYNLVCTWL